MLMVHKPMLQLQPDTWAPTHTTDFEMWLQNHSDISQIHFPMQKFFDIILSWLCSHIKPQIIRIFYFDRHIYGPMELTRGRLFMQSLEKNLMQIARLKLGKSFNCMDFDGFNCCSTKCPIFYVN